MPSDRSGLNVRDDDTLDGEGLNDEGITNARLMAMARAAVNHAKSSGMAKRKAAWVNSHRAYNNEHVDTSKYKHPNFRARSKNFVPKTRSAVKKSMVAAATALFSTADVVSVQPEDDENEQQLASADMHRFLLNYRLDRTNHRAGIPWYHTSMSAVQDMKITGVCFSKQYWEFEECEDEFEAEPIEDAAKDRQQSDALQNPGGIGSETAPDPMQALGNAGLPNPGNPLQNPGLPSDMLGMAGMGAAPQPMGLSQLSGNQPSQGQLLTDPAPDLAAMSMAGAEPGLGSQSSNVIPFPGATIKKKRILRDRPMVQLHPPENIIIDTAAPFTDIVQGGSYFVAMVPMTVGDIRSMMKPGHQYQGGGGWFSMPDKVISEAVSDYAGSSVRSARERGTDRFSRQNTPKVSDFDLVWVHENFVRCEGRDFHFWSLGTRKLLSEPRETIEAYPAFHGERPFVMGLGEIEAHTALPMSTVEALKPLQDEINDIRNLTLDTVKQAISPVTIVKRGGGIDLRQVREKGPDALIMVGDKDDVTFDRPPDATPSAFMQQDRLNVEMDEIAGAFSTSSVQSNRSLNETVGGMQLMSGSANAITEFDLRIAVETWVEPVMRHLIWLEQYYETDARLISLAGKKAGAFEKFGNDVDLDELLVQQVTVRVNVGIGSSDPMQKLGKLQQGLTILLGLGESGAFAGQVEFNAEAMFDEVFGLCGYKQANRFCEFKTIEEVAQAKAQEPPPPEMMQLQIEQQKVEQEGQIAAQEGEVKKAELQLRMKETETKLQIEQAKLGMAQQDANLQAQDMQMRQGMAQQDMGLKARQQDHAERSGQMEYGLKDRAQGFTEQQGQHGMGMADRQQGFTEQSGQAEHGFKQRQQQHVEQSGERDHGLKDRDHSLKEREFTRTGETGAKEHEFKERVQTHAEKSGKRDHGLKVAGHNKTMADETTEAGDPEPNGLEKAVAAIAEAVAAMATSTQALIKSQADQNKMIADMAKAAAAPKRIVRNADGNLIGIEPINGESL